MKNKAKIPRKLVSKVHIYITLCLECTQIKKKKRLQYREKILVIDETNGLTSIMDRRIHVKRIHVVLDHIRGGYVIQRKIYLLDVMRDD